MTPNELLLAAIKARTKNAEFGLGINTAAAFVKNIQECVGVDACYRYAATKANSWQDVMTKAAKTLVYTNDDMKLEEQLWEKVPGVEIRKLKGIKQVIDGEEVEGDIELPKNTLMVFRHTLTTPRKDRDGDILRTAGAKPDPKMLLLWQHVHTLPIGKMLAVTEHNKNKLKMVSAIVDMNELSHDAAVMIDNDMGRFSHGFRALDFVEMKAADGVESAGFDVKSFEIMEESLVSVPSNTDADMDEVMLSLVEGGKLTSHLMKAQGKAIREKRAVRIPVSVELNIKTIFDGKEVANGATGTITKAGAPAATKCGCGGPVADCGCGGKPGASEEANGGTDEGKAKRTEDAEVTKDKGGDKCSVCGAAMKDGKCASNNDHVQEKKAFGGHDSEDDDEDTAKCPDCDEPLKDGKCECGYEKPKDEEVAKLVAAIHKHYTDQPRSTAGKWTNGSQIMTRIAGIVEQYLEQLPAQVGNEAAADAPKNTKPQTVKDAMATVVALASPAERAKLKSILEAQEGIDKEHELVESYAALTGKGFCPTGAGGGIDNSCGGSGSGGSSQARRGGYKTTSTEAANVSNEAYNLTKGLPDAKGFAKQAYKANELALDALTADPDTAQEYHDEAVILHRVIADKHITKGGDQHKAAAVKHYAAANLHQKASSLIS